MEENVLGRGKSVCQMQRLEIKLGAFEKVLMAGAMRSIIEASQQSP